MGELKHDNYLDNLSKTNNKKYMEVIDAGISANEIKSQINELDNTMQMIDNNIKNKQSQLKRASKDEKQTLIDEVKQMNQDKQTIINEKNNLLKLFNDNRINLTNKGNEEMWSVKPGQKLFADHIIDSVSTNRQTTNNFLNKIKDNNKIRYYSNLAKNKLYDLTTGTRFRRLTNFDSFQNKLKTPSARRVFGDKNLSGEIQKYLEYDNIEDNNTKNNVRGGKKQENIKTRKYKNKKLFKHNNRNRKNKSKKYRK